MSKEEIEEIEMFCDLLGIDLDEDNPDYESALLEIVTLSKVMGDIKNMIENE